MIHPPAVWIINGNCRMSIRMNRSLSLVSASMPNGILSGIDNSLFFITMYVILGTIRMITNVVYRVAVISWNCDREKALTYEKSFS